MSTNKKFLDLNRYKLLFLIGSGSFSKVFQVKELNTGQIYAAKISNCTISKRKKHSEETLLLYREINLLSLLNHPSIIKFIGYSQVNFEKKPHPTIVTEFATNGSLRDIINMELSSLSPDDWTITKKLIIIYGISAGMSYLHANNVLHRDLKPENILMDDYLHPKISDFGMSKMTTLDDSKYQSAKGIKGTYMYLAPEIFSVQTYSKEADVYAFAYIVYEIMNGEVPFEKFQFFQILQKVAIEGYRPSIKEDVPKAYKELIECCWSQNPEERPSFDKIVENLKTNEEFITETTDESEFLQYVDFIDNYKSTFDTSKQLISYEDFIKVHGHKKSSQKVKLSINQDDKNALKNKANQTKSQINDEILFSSPQLDELNHECKALVEEAKNNAEKQFIVGKSLIEGINGFPQIITLGLQYIAQSNSNNCLESILYYIRLLYKGKIILKDLKEADRMYDEIAQIHNKQFCILIGKILIDKKFYNDAMNFFEQGAKEGDQECMYNCAKMLFIGIGCTKNNHKSIQYLTQLKGQGHSKSEYFLKALDTMNKFQEFTKLPADAQYVFISNIIKNLNSNSHKNKDDAMFKSLQIKSNKTEQLFYNKSLKSTNFHNCIKKFVETKIEVEYPSKIFKRIIDLVDKIKNQNSNSIQIGIVFTSFREIVDKYCFSPNISYHTIDNSFYFIKEYAFCKRSLLKHFIVPPLIISIEKYAFSDCTSLKQITMSSSVAKINDYAFQNCVNLEEITIPPSVVTIGNYCFSVCSNLTKITIPSSVTSIGNNAFFGCLKLEQVSLSFSVITIGNSAFQGCSNLIEISIPYSVTTIGDCAFFGCSKLERVSLSSSITKIGNGAFQECFNLLEISIPSSVTSIGNKAFSGCSKLEQVTLPSSETRFDDDIFEGINSLFVKGNIKYIPKQLFFKSLAITQLTIGSSITSIEENAFYLCSSLKQISFEIPCSIKEIGNGVFYGCSSLIDVEIPSTVTTIGSNVFYLCSSLKQITLPSSVTSIGDHAFFGCSSLQKVTFLSQISSIGANFFSGCSSLKEISIPNSVTSIGNDAFNKCFSLEEIKIPSSVTEIGYGAFNGCSSLKQIDIPSSVNSIGTNTFAGCKSLTRLKIPSSIKTFFIGINNEVIVKEKGRVRKKTI